MDGTENLNQLYLAQTKLTNCTVPASRGRSETFRRLTKCQSVLSEGSNVLVVTEGKGNLLPEGVCLQLARELPVASAAQRPVVRLSERPVAYAMSVL